MTTAADLIEKVAIGFQEKLDSLNSAADNARAAGLAATLLAGTYLSTDASVTLYIDAVNGDDENPVYSRATPAKTWAGVHSKCESGRLNLIVCLSDVDADERVTFTQPPSTIRYIGQTTAGAFADRKIRFVDAISTANAAGGLYSHADITIATQSISLEDAHTVGLPPIYTHLGHLVVRIIGGALSKTGTGGAMCHSVCSAHYSVTSVAIDPSISGSVIQGVSAGSDPNDVPGISANFPFA